MDVTAWLRGLGLEQYAPAFRDNHIDADVLPRLTSEDLQELGIISIGHRRRLLSALAALGNSQAAESLPFSEFDTAEDIERRRLTVMFCDLVGSTPLSTVLDPEDLEEIIEGYHRCVAEAVARFDGFMLRCLGDGVIALFGYPQANEHDAEHAIRSGLALIDAIGQVKGSHDLRLRIGIASGDVVVRNPSDEREAHIRDVVGEAPNLAARLQTVAQPNTIVIGDKTRAHVGGIFEVADLGSLSLKGFAEPQRAWRIIGESGVLSRFEALRSASAPLVGRNEELDLLLRRWQQAKAGEGRVVFVSGEPGIGKSRMTVALSYAIQNEPHRRLRYFCSPYHQDSALYPIVAHLESAAGWKPNDFVDQKIEKLQRLLGRSVRGNEEIALISELMSLPNSFGEFNLSPESKRDKLFAALLHQLESRTGSRPTLIIFEDAHWIDPTSLALLDQLISRISKLPILLVVTVRPEFQLAWTGSPYITTVVLNRLSGGEGVALVERLAGDRILPRETVEKIVERSDGVPLFVEELTKAVLEAAGHSHESTPHAPANRSTIGSIPETLHASLIARFDRLGPYAKDVAQIGAVIGREFGFELLRQIARRSTVELKVGLDRLTQAGLLFCRGIGPNFTYVFKHALVRDAAYGSLLRPRQRELHARVSEILRRGFGDLIERQPEILAYHLSAAGETQLAVDQWLKAGQHAAARSAHIEAINHFDRGLAMLLTLPEGPARNSREIDLQLARGPSLFAAKGFAAPEAATAYTRARELAEQRADTQQLFTAVNGLWQYANGAGKILDCRNLSSRLQALAAGSEDDALRLQAHHSAWATCLFSGEFAAARDHCDEGRRLYDPERHRFQHQLYGGHDPGACAHYLSAQVHWVLGHPKKALWLANEAIALAEQSGHAFTFACALQYSSMLHLDRGEPEVALQRLEAAEAVATEQRLGFVLEPKLLRGAALMEQGDLEIAVAYLREGLAGRIGATRLQCYGLVRLADALVRQGEHAPALGSARNALSSVERTGHRQWQAEAHRLEGIALIGLGQIEEGQIALAQAIRIAREQQAKSNELRATTVLARLLGEKGRRPEGRALLAEILSSFSEGFDTADLKEAKVLLDELA